MERQNSKRPRRRKREDSEFDHKVLEVARVARVVKGGRRFSFRVIVVIGDKKGRVGIGTGKGPDTATGVEKAIRHAKKNISTIVTKGGTISHEILFKYGSAKILLKPAKVGKGIVAGGAIRTVCELVGLKDISAKMLGGSNKLNNAKATVMALGKIKAK